MNRLPLDLLVQILLLLPVKTIIRCTSVCKLWNSLINKPTFTNIPFKHQPSNLMLAITYNHNAVAVYTMHCDADETFYPYVGLRLDRRINPLSKRVCKIIGTCNGVICGAVELTSMKEEIIMWNPTIRKALNIPSPELPLTGISISLIPKFNFVYAFGFDPNTDDFKVIRIADYFDKNSDFHAPVFLSFRDIKLYSLRTRSWRNITGFAEDVKYYIPKRSPSVVLHGAAHWFGAKNSDTSDTTVISFNFSDELFYCFGTRPAISFNSRLDQFGSTIIPSVIQGSLSLIEHSESRCTIWVMGRYGDSSSCTKHLDITLLDDFNRVVGFRKNGEILIQILRRLFSFEHKSADGKEYSIRSVEGLTTIYSEGYRPNIESSLNYLGLACHFNHAHCESFVETMALFGTTATWHVKSQHGIGNALENIKGVVDRNNRKRKAQLGGVKIN